MKANKQFSISANKGTKQFTLTPSAIENTIGQFFGIEWEKINGKLRLANGHVLGFETPSGNPTQDASQAHYMVISDRNSISTSRPQGIVKVSLDRVNYFRIAGLVYGHAHMRGNKHNPLQASGLVR